MEEWQDRQMHIDLLTDFNIIHKDITHKLKQGNLLYCSVSSTDLPLP